MKPKDKETPSSELTEVIRDLTRVLIILHEEDISNSEMVRRLHNFSVSPTRIAKLLGMQLKDVTSIISKMKKNKKALKVV